jgi:hypothetical protein
MKLYSLSNFDRLYLRQYRSYEQTFKHRTASFWPEKGFGTSLGCHRYFSMTQLPLQVKRTVAEADFLAIMSQLRRLFNTTATMT